MTFIVKTAHPRDRKTCAKKSFISHLQQRITQAWRARNHPHIKDLSPRFARDAGLSDIEVAQHQHRWPSETTHHPRG